MSALDGLAKCAGTWRGTNTLHDPNTGKPEESLSAATVTPVLGGRFIRLDYTWSYQGKPQEGSILLGHAPESGELSAHWIDSWHMGRKVLACRGSTSDCGTFSVRGTFPAPPDPDWGWRIDIVPNDESMRIEHTCIDSGGNEEPAVQGRYGRS